MDASLRWDAEVDGVCALPIRVVRPVAWRRHPDRDVVELRMDRAGRTTEYAAKYAHLLEGIETGHGIPALVDRLVDAGVASRSEAVRMTLRFVHGLAAEGNLEVVVPPPPPTFDGRFAVVRELGRGGVGIAWLCRDLGRAGEPPVVVKHAWNFAGDLAKRDRSIRAEATLVEALTHPRVAALVATFEVEDRFHLVRDYVDGEELYRRVLRDGAPAAPARRAVARSLADLLAHVHRTGHLWMDANPSNLLVPAGRPIDAFVVADVGHCRAMADGEVRLEGRVGRHTYVAPELRTGAPATVRTDVYGLGFFHAFLLTERKPAPDASRARIMRAARERGADAGEVRFLEACLAPSPEDRPRDPAAAVALLEG